MRCRFHPTKCKMVLANRGISLEQATEVFNQIYILGQKNDAPLQYRALGEYFHRITTWKSTPMEQQLYAENT